MRGRERAGLDFRVARRFAKPPGLSRRCLWRFVSPTIPVIIAYLPIIARRFRAGSLHLGLPLARAPCGIVLDVFWWRPGFLVFLGTPEGLERFGALEA